MKNLITFGFLACLATGCALFTVGGSGYVEPEIERSQRSSAGVVHLWKAELDSGNLAAATELMRRKNGDALLAVERYELADELQRWQKRLGGKPITSTTIDTLSNDQHTVHLKVDYIRTATFTTLSRAGTWFITNIQ
ncbi:MAG: hypothetical protein J5I53_06340 [Bradyrhizobiaceae bacterium]|nr:hypothetical protein [Bradyrhizobiaceae bacterium]